MNKIKAKIALKIIAASVLIPLLTMLAAFAAIVLLSTGLLSIFVALGALILPISYLASDLSPSALLFTGFFCLFGAASLALALFIHCPKAVRRFGVAVERLFL
ncbi:MAG: hypothetical protein FWH20_03785 [Oscillospiraceae bacterium]|nr:hypothetical protein [Oscillospiraceae bacterium]